MGANDVYIASTSNMFDHVIKLHTLESNLNLNAVDATVITVPRSACM